MEHYSRSTCVGYLKKICWKKIVILVGGSVRAKYNEVSL